MTTILDSVVDSALPSVFVDGRKLPDAVTLIVGTEVYDAWDGISIRRSLEAMSGSFSISITDKWRQSGEAWPLVPGAEILVKIGKENMINGYIYTLEAGVRNDDRSITVSGRDKTGDLVDSSAHSDPSEFKNVTVTQLAEKFATEIFGIPVVAEADVGNAFEKFTIKQGETVFEMLERAAKLRGLLLITNGKGDLIITNRSGGDIGAPPSLKNPVESFEFTPPSIVKSEVSLIQGENILEAKATYDHSDRFQTYLIKGQAPGTEWFNTENVALVSATARDLAITRSRTLIVMAEGSVDKAAAQKRANWEAIVRATRAVEVEIRVQGWLKPDGNPWAVNELVRVEAGFIGINSDLLVTGAGFTKEKNSGTITTLKLSRPDSYDPSKDELSAESDPTGRLGWQKTGVEAAYDSLKGLYA